MPYSPRSTRLIRKTVMLYLSQSTRRIGGGRRAANLHWMFRRLVAADLASQRSADPMKLEAQQQIRISNPGGLDILRELSSLKEQLAAEKFSHDHRIASLEAKIAFQDARIADQIAALELADSSQEGRIRMMYGDETAYGGDAVTDVTLFTMPGGRTDPEVFQTLYGLLPETVSQYISG